MEGQFTMTDPDGCSYEWDHKGTIDVKIDDTIIASIPIKNADRLVCCGEWIEAIVNMFHEIGCPDRVHFRYMPSDLKEGGPAT